jgi:hypothetical protein
MEAERNRRKQLLDTQAQINVAEGQKQRVILESEGHVCFFPPSPCLFNAELDSLKPCQMKQMQVIKQLFVRLKLGQSPQFEKHLRLFLNAIGYSLLANNKH